MLSWRRLVVIGILSGLAMAAALFLGGAIASRITYGPQMAPEGKFEADKINALYFLWTKALIGACLGIVFSILYDRLPLARRLSGPWVGVKYGLVFWFVVSLWNMSHPIVYGTTELRDKLFWLVYSACGFAGYGAAFGFLYGRSRRRVVS